jgi:hypothetical protein
MTSSWRQRKFRHRAGVALAARPGYVRVVQAANGYRTRIGELLATRQRRLLLLDGLVVCAIVEAPIAGIASQMLAAAPLLLASLVVLHLVAAASTRLRA